ncbi:alpha,alpha-trehalase TreF [Aliiglaciecola sp. 2_MG-2023]|uniref:alpha,alpha-trehalase TreF n=1 Tax=unclassified Aliiglaciecola TaxID=2593648 RepID=UPI0026E2CBCE|nr:MULTISPECIES: alpha,alpha-trehalase TreF [unclassified Aliiglaciecola]MDO6712961.1 alpha,alpha-trehalase TreF [Aliiglaciecola sp. 2_MG-2023]MDO6754000.1 alpha,alpha-trehalase TreF [Aliiglaciecola sp. 1_MG-2023]
MSTLIGRQTAGNFEQSLAFFSSALFHQVQTSGLFTDSKHFADATPKTDWDEIYQQYEQQSASGHFKLAEFVEQYFSFPEPIKLAENVRYQTVAEHIEALWSLLQKQPDVDSKDSLLPLRFPYLVPGGRFREIYYWDSYFTSLGLLSSGRKELVKSMVLNFIQLQKDIGCIPNGNRSYYFSRSQPPVLGLMVDMLFKSEGNYKDLDFLKECVEAMDSEYAFWMAGAEQLSEPFQTHRRSVRMPNGGILNRYWDEQACPRAESYAEDIDSAEHKKDHEKSTFYRHIRAACESGWDFSSRWLADTEDLQSIQTTDIIPVDLNCLLYQLEVLLSQYWDLLGQKSKSQLYQQKSETRKVTIQSYFWDSTDNFYRDFNLKTTSQSAVMSLAGVLPLFVNLANHEQAEAVASRLENEFLCAGGLLTTLCQSSQQWDAPNGWAPLHWFAVKGLQQYQQNELATRIMQNWLANVEHYFQAHGSLMEKYNVKEIDHVAQGGEYEVQHGFGWTNGVTSAFYQLMESNQPKLELPNLK